MLRIRRISKKGPHGWLLEIDHKLLHQKKGKQYRVFIGVILVFCAVIAYTYSSDIFHAFKLFVEWIMINPFRGAFVYIFIYGISAVFMVPALLLSLGAGYIYSSVYGTFWGIIIAFIVDLVGATFGAVLSFWMSRFLFYEWIEQWTKSYPTFQIAQKLLKVNAIKVILILRVMMPYHILNYLLGITNVTTYQYLIGCLGMVVPTLTTCCIGSTITKMEQLHDLNVGEPHLWSFLKENLLIGICLIGALGFATYSVGKKAYREFNEMKKELDDYKDV